jgi:hypothetical protein
MYEAIQDIKRFEYMIMKPPRVFVRIPEASIIIDSDSMAVNQIGLGLTST